MGAVDKEASAPHNHGMHSLANPTRFMTLSNRLISPLAAAAFLLLGIGLYFALLASPQDYQQGEAVRIMYVHVPAAWLSLGIYTFMTMMSAIFLIWRHHLADIASRAAAPLGAGFTLLTLVTGSLWGKPMWGAWWVWDARLTSVLVLFFIYMGYIALAKLPRPPSQTARACAIFALVGFVNIPIIKFSVEWWNTLHQPASLIRSGGPAIAMPMLIPLLVMATSFAIFFIWLELIRIRTLLMESRIRRLQTARN